MPAGIQSIQQWFASTGLFGGAVILVGLALQIAAVFVAVLSDRRGPNVVMLGLAFVPTLIGVAGTVVGMINVFRLASTHSSTDSGILTAGISESSRTTMLGLAITVVIAAFVVAGLGMKPKSDAGPPA